MKQKDRHFTPHVLAIPVGSTVDFPNLDPIYHNAFSNFSGQPFDTGLYPPGTTQVADVQDAGIVRVFCNIHPTMSAIIAVLPTPWYAATPASGKFTIANVPAGDYDLHIFHERSLPEVLQFLERTITVPESGLTLPLISISETGLHPDAAPEQVRPTLSAGARTTAAIPGATEVNATSTSPACRCSRKSCSPLPWRSPCSSRSRARSCCATSTQTVSDSLEDEVRNSFQAYASLLKSRAELLSSVSRIMATLPEVRLAFGTGDRHTIKDTASEMWAQDLAFERHVSGDRSAGAE